MGWPPVRGASPRSIAPGGTVAGGGGVTAATEVSATGELDATGEGLDTVFEPQLREDESARAKSQACLSMVGSREHTARGRAWVELHGSDQVLSRTGVGDGP